MDVLFLIFFVYCICLDRFYAKTQGEICGSVIIADAAVVDLILLDSSFIFMSLYPDVDVADLKVDIV